MNIFAIIVSILAMLSFIFIFAAIHLKNNDNDNADIVFGCFIGLISSTFVIFLIVIIINPITPIEVYRGNTTLQITYQDSVPIDSIVVYKNK